MKIAIIGLGFVGLSLASVLASKGNNVIGIDVDVKKCKKICSGITPFFEPDLEKTLKIGLKKKLTISNDFSLIEDCDMIFVAVGTPQKSNGAIELSMIKKAVTSIGRILAKSKKKSIVLIKSTVIPGTMQNAILPILEKRSGKKAGKEFGLISNPEFLQESSAIKDTKFPHVIVLGGYQTKFMKKAKSFFSKIGKMIFCIVPGVTVLFMRIILSFLLFARILPIDVTAFLIIDSSIAPFDFCGVPTATKIISESLTNEKSLLIVNFFFNPIFSVFSKSGSKNGVIPLQIFLHFLTSTSIPTTLFPFDANTLASDNPTKPKPITAIFILSSKFLILKIMPS